MMILLYRILYIPGLILGLPYYAFRMWRRGGYRKSFENRFGVMSKVPPKRENVKRIWIQAVSVGELLAIIPLLKRLHADPDLEVILTTTTSTGLRLLEERMADFTVWHGVFPMDFWLCSSKAWKALQPDTVILMEGELWPEHIHQAQKRSVPVLLLNARLSDKSFKRHQSVRNLARSYFGKLSAILASSDTDRERFESLGWIPRERIISTGNLKFDVELEAGIDSEAREKFVGGLGFDSNNPFILLGSSTWPDEESALIEAYIGLREEFTDLRLLIVPRHAERKGELTEMVKNLPVKVHFRSDSKQAPIGTEVYIADTTGELRMITGFADLVIIGKSFPPNVGGQTPVEAAAMGKAMLFGPDMSNFRDICRNLIRAGAAIRIESTEAIQDTLRSLLKSSGKRSQMGAAAADCINQSRGATERAVSHIKEAG